MGTIKVPKPVKLIVSLITSDDVLLHHVGKILEESYGDADFMSDSLAFNVTDYYEEEMGKGLFRRFMTFADLIQREALVQIKADTNVIEERHSVEGKRRINLDPGYIAAEHLILATTKGYTHRPYLGDGIYADLTLIYRKGEFQPLEWTYPDYASQQVRQVLHEVRNGYIRALKEV